MKRSIYSMRADRVARRAAFCTVRRLTPASRVSLAQKYGDGLRIRSQPFVGSVPPDTGTGALELPADLLTANRDLR